MQPAFADALQNAAAKVHIIIKRNEESHKELLFFMNSPLCNGDKVPSYAIYICNLAHRKEPRIESFAAPCSCSRT